MLARIPEELWEALCKESRREDRSATAQLIHILRERYDIPANGKEEPPAKGKK